MKTDELKQAVEKRRTFAIISHPDAGKTTITEQLLLFGGVVRQAGTVKAKKSGNFAKSDWMEIEKKRGISVTSSVMQFDYAGKRVNILDTPGHEDFSEDTYRTLMAVDSAVMVIDSAKGIEPQTKKLFQICKMRGLDGTHGVMIPQQNIRNLNLSNEIVQAVKDGKFHIYAISTIEEGIEILTGVPAGKKDSQGHFPAGSVNALAYEKLKKYAQISQK